MSDIYHSLKQHLARTCLTAFGVFWGVFMLIILLGVTNGMENGAAKAFGGVTKTLYVWINASTQRAYKGMSPGRRPRLNNLDLSQIRSLEETQWVSAVNDLGGWRNAVETRYLERLGSFLVSGIEPEGFILANYQIDKGRAFNRMDLEEKRKVAVIGTSVQSVLFGKDNSIGQSIKIRDIEFKVIGVFSSLEEGESRIYQAEKILLPHSSLRLTFNQMSQIGYFQIQAKPGMSADTLFQSVRTVIEENHRIHPEDKGVVANYNTEELYERSTGVYSSIRYFGWVVAVVTIFVGVVGVANIMLIVVKEKTQEIGLRKAIGAKPRQIIVAIVLEAMLIILISGYFGLVFAVALLEVLSSLLGGMSTAFVFGVMEVDLSTALFSILVLLVAGFFASLVPAYKAASIDPILALQDE